MSKDSSPGGCRSMADTAAELKPAGSAPDHADHEKAGHEKARNPDAELHFDEAGSLYDDGLDIKESSDLLYGAHGTSWGIKP